MNFKGSGFLNGLIKGSGFLILGSWLGAQAGQAQERQSILQQPRLSRLDSALLDARAPEQRVRGAPGTLRIVDRGCRNLPTSSLRERIVYIAVQEWAWFGFLVDDLRNDNTDTANASADTQPPWRLGLDPDEVTEVASSIGGYWAGIPGSDWILERQNASWREAGGLASRWRDPWSAAFISWVLCESGVSDQQQFQRAIAHHSYIDQAIRARDAQDPQTLYYAYEPGEAEILPGDLLCSGLRPLYRSLRERRAQLGEGARSHCDIVVHVGATQILTIGGNVRASVRMKIHAAGQRTEHTRPAPLAARRPVFAHLKLRAATANSASLLQSPSLQQLHCELPALVPTLALDLALPELETSPRNC
jgi:hypothetical protein